MAKIQFAMSIAPEKGYFGIGYCLNLRPVAVRMSPHGLGFEIALARPFEEVSVVPGMLFHAIPGLAIWETEAASSERIEENHLTSFADQIPILPLSSWEAGEVINTATHFVSCEEDISQLVPTALSPVSFLVFAGSEVVCKEYISSHPQKRKEIYKIVANCQRNF